MGGNLLWYGEVAHNHSKPNLDELLKKIEDGFPDHNELLKCIIEYRLWISY